MATPSTATQTKTRSSRRTESDNRPSTNLAKKHIVQDSKLNGEHPVLDDEVVKGKDVHVLQELRHELETSTKNQAVLSEKTNKLMEALTLLTNYWQQVDETIKTHGIVMNQLSQHLEDNNNTVTTLREMNSRQEAKISQLEMEVNTLKSESHDGVLLWRIDDYRKRKADSLAGNPSSIYSGNFYTSFYGYKMCARVYIAGDGMGKGQYLSIFFTLKKGRYDDALKWPFRHKVTFILVNQDQQGDIVDAFFPDPKSTSFQRPTKDMNVAAGCPKFALSSVIENPSRGFLKNNAIYLKVVVDITG